MCKVQRCGRTCHCRHLPSSRRGTSVVAFSTRKIWSPRGLLGGSVLVGHKVKLCNYPTTVTTDLILTYFLAVMLFLFIDPALSFILVVCLLPARLSLSNPVYQFEGVFKLCDFTSDVVCLCVEGFHA